MGELIKRGEMGDWCPLCFDHYGSGEQDCGGHSQEEWDEHDKGAVETVSVSQLPGWSHGFAAGKAEGVAQVQAYAEKEARAAEMRAGLIPQEADSNNAVAYAARSIARKATTEHSDALTSMLAEARAEVLDRAAAEFIDIAGKPDDGAKEPQIDICDVVAILQGMAADEHLSRAAEDRTKQR